MADAEAMGAAVTRPAILRRRLGYEPARGERTAQAKALQASIHHGEIEIGNLSSKMDHDSELRDLDRQLVFEVDMSKGSLQQQTTMVR